MPIAPVLPEQHVTITPGGLMYALVTTQQRILWLINTAE